MDKYEYLVKRIDYTLSDIDGMYDVNQNDEERLAFEDELTNTLNELGAHGWQLLKSNGCEYLFMRKI